jgi:hypothetical protein
MNMLAVIVAIAISSRRGSWVIASYDRAAPENSSAPAASDVESRSTPSAQISLGSALAYRLGMSVGLIEGRRV